MGIIGASDTCRMGACGPLRDVSPEVLRCANPTPAARAARPGGPVGSQARGRQGAAQSVGAGPTPEAAPERQARGNEAARARLPEQPDAGLARYEDALGEFLGGELYRAVEGALRFERLEGYARDALGGALGAMGGQLGQLDGVTADPAAVDALVAMVQARLDPVLDGWLAAEGHAVADRLSGWAGASPRAVAGVALLAAAGAVLADLEIPALKRLLKLGDGTDATVEVELGRLRALALKRVRATLSHASGPLVGAIELNHGEGGTTGAASLKLAEEKRSIEAKGTFDGDGLVVAGLSGRVETAAGRIEGGITTERGREGAIATLGIAREEGPLALTGDFSWDAGTGALTLGASALRKLDDTELSAAVTGASDGSRSARAGVTRRRAWGEVSASASTSREAFGLSEEQKLQLGVKYDRETLRAALDAAVARANGSTTATLEASVERDFGDGRRVGATLDLAAGDNRLLEAGAFYGFKDPEAFRSWLVEYRHRSRLDDHALKIALEEAIGPVLVRAQSAVAWGGSGRTLDVSAHAAYFTAPETALVAGATLRRDFEGGRSAVTPEVGVQHKGVQVLFGYDAETKGATIRLGVPF